MRSRLWSLPLVAVLVLTSCGRRSDSSIETVMQGTVVGGTADGVLLTSDGRLRTYHLYVPSTLPEGPVPLLIALHGGTGSGTQFQEQSGFDELAELHGLLVVYPDGVGLGRNESLLRTWNGGYCCGAAARRQVNDVAFIDALIDEIASAYDVDPNRVFAAGHSNGGIMAYRLACELSDRIAAIGLQAGSLGIDECTPEQPVSVLHLHGTADENHPIEGGVGDRSISDTDFNSAAYSVETVAAAMGCQTVPTATAAATDCADGTEVRLVAVEGAPHKWMDDASAVILEFLLAHPRTQ